MIGRSKVCGGRLGSISTVADVHGRYLHRLGAEHRSGPHTLLYDMFKIVSFSEDWLACIQRPTFEKFN